MCIKKKSAGLDGRPKNSKLGLGLLNELKASLGYNTKTLLFVLHSYKRKSLLYVVLTRIDSYCDLSKYFRILSALNFDIVMQNSNSAEVECLFPVSCLGKLLGLAVGLSRQLHGAL